MATINLGSIKFNWQGAYAGGTAYAVDDVVSYSGSSYICTAASTGNLPTDTNFWDQMSSAGTNGTDLTTTLTTQGDILYRDGSGLQRLPKGTAGQVLQMNSGATAPEYGNVSSDWVKLSSATLGSDASNIQIDNLFDSSTYNHYALKFIGYATNSGGWLNGRIINSSGTVVTSEHYSVLNRGNLQSSGSSNSVSSDWNGDRFYFVQTANVAQQTSQGIIYIMNPHSTTQWKSLITVVSGWDGTTVLHSGNGAHVWSNTGTMRGIELFNSGGTLKSGFQTVLYGIK